MRNAAIRINARLTGEDARRFKELQSSRKLSATDVLRLAIRSEHARTVRPHKSPYETMLKSGLIGSIKGPRDGSSAASIRRATDDVLRAKYPHHYRDAK